MSYDFRLFTPRPGRDPREIVDNDDEFERGPRNPKIEALKRKVADALVAHDARLTPATPNFEEMARLHGMSPAEAYDRFRRLELNDEKNPASGIQITLFDDGAALSIPYWHKGERARAVLGQAWAYLDIICGACGYEVFDRQLDRVIDVNAFDEVFVCYASATARMDEVVGRVPRKPWWKFW
jgi:hypothetical protein